MSSGQVGVMTERWGWQPTARLGAEGLPAWAWRAAPAGLVTRRQARALGLSPAVGRHVGWIECRNGRRWARLWVLAELRPLRPLTPAKRQALEKAMAARRWCPSCQRDAGYCIPTSVGTCMECVYPELAEIDREHRDQFEAAA